MKTDKKDKTSILRKIVPNPLFKINGIQKIAVLGIICAVAIVGRLGFNVLTGFIPNIQPVTVLIILIAIYFGEPSAIISVWVIIYITNLFLGMGIWSVYQCITFILIALISCLLRHFKNIYIMIVWAAFSGILYGFLISIFSHNAMVIGTSNTSFWIYWMNGFLFADISHAIGNTAFMLALYPLFNIVISKQFAQK